MSDRSKGIIVFILLLLLLVPAAAFGWNADNNPDKIIKGAVYVNGIPVGGMDVEAARQAVSRKLVNFPNTPVQLVYSDKKWDFNFSELGIAAQVDKAVEAAQELGHTGPVTKRINERWKALSDGIRIKVPVSLDEEIIEAKLNPIGSKIETKARDARYTYHNQKVEIIPHVAGSHLDLQRTVAQLLALAEKQTEKPGGSITLALPVEITYPTVTNQILAKKSLTNVVGAYATHFNTGQTGRSKNILMAAKYLDGYVIPPGAVFSFNESVGPRTKEAGFEEALIILDEQFLPGLGGGVCQVSSTLYNAALRAGMKITERSRHSKVIAYVPVGLDAAVSYGYLDLKFINTTDAYVAICAEVYGGTLDLRLLSEKENPYTIEIRAFIENTVKPKTEIRKDGGIAQGKEYIQNPGKNGHVTRVERIWYKDGREVKRETISRDFYPAEARVIVRGSQSSPVVKPGKKQEQQQARPDQPEKKNENIPEPGLDVNGPPEPEPETQEQESVQQAQPPQQQTEPE